MKTRILRALVNTIISGVFVFILIYISHIKFDIIILSISLIISFLIDWLLFSKIKIRVFGNILNIITAVLIYMSLSAIILDKSLSEQKKAVKGDQQISIDKKAALEAEFQTLVLEYEKLKINDSAIDKHIDAEIGRINKLLSLTQDNATKIRLYELELKTCKEIFQTYKLEIDSIRGIK